MDDIRTALISAGWSDEVIRSFLQPDINVVCPIPMSAYVVDTHVENYDDLAIPRKMDSSTLVFSCKGE